MTNSSTEESILSEFGDMLKLGGTELTIVPEIQRIKFLKNMWNCIFGPIAALSQNTPSAIFRPPETPNEGTTRVSDAKELESGTGTLDDPSDLPFSHPLIGQHTIPFIKDVFKELITLGNAIFPSTPDGPGLDPRFTFNTLKTTAHIFSKPTSIERPSMLVDVELGRPMELEVVVGEVVRLGKKHRISMPVWPN